VTKLDRVGSNYYLDPVAGGTGPVLKLAGAAVAVGQYPGWAVFAAEQTAGGYDVAWQNTGTGQFSVWATDSSGNFTSTLVGHYRLTAAQLALHGAP